MKIKIFIAVFLLFSVNVFAFDITEMHKAAVARKNIAGSSPSPTYIVKQDFEGTGYDNSESWTEETATDGTVNEDYTTEALAGSQSLYLEEGTGGDVHAYIDLGADYADIYGYVMFQVDSDWPNTSNRYAASFRNSSGVFLAGFTFNISDTTVAVNGRIGSTNGTPCVETTTEGATIHVWFEYSNTNDTIDIFWSTNGTKPSNVSDYHMQATTSISTDARRLYLTCDAAGESLIYDKVRVDDVQIGSNPE